MYGSLTVLGVAGISRHKKVLWNLRCGCGKEFSAVAAQVKSGKTSSCGCLRSRGNPKHGLRSHVLYSTWCNMKARCDNPKHPQYADYGGRGISYCSEWAEFPAFLADVGERPFDGASLDRIDNDGNYEPSNVRWADRRTQRVNSRQVTLVTIGGETRLVTDWCRLYGISIGAVHRRLQKGMGMVEAITAPKAKRFL